MNARLSFHGAARTVTGSKYLLELDQQSVLIDAGLFQGLKELRQRNWEAPDFDPKAVDRVLLTHAHIDHIGFLPKLVRLGLRCPVVCTTATAELARILLLDSAEIHEEDARYANKKGFSKHKPALPLYSVEDAKQALKLLEPVRFGEKFEATSRVVGTFHGAGHILGAAHLELLIEAERGAQRSLVFSGDIGRYDMPLHLDPKPRPRADVLVCESTYGNRDHDHEPLVDQLRGPLERAFRRRGTVLIPSFAVGRAQQLALVLRRLMASDQIQEVPVHIDSPMAVDATAIYSHHLDEHHLDADVFADGRQVLFPDNIELVRTVDQSKALNNLAGPRIIISASGMLTGGRVLHHLKRLLGERNNLVIMAGYQAPGTRGRKLLEGTPTVRIHGIDIPVRAECLALGGLSAHADRGELMRWLRSNEHAPNQTFLTHGEPEAAFDLRERIARELGWNVDVPEMGEVVDLLPLLYPSA
jgi:metallo-beta-lactamase family protein